MKEEFKFLDPEELIDNELSLILIEKNPAIPEKDYVPAYKFKMVNASTKEEMGQIDLRIGNNENIKYRGHIGYKVHENFRGHHYAARSVKLLLGLAKKHNLDFLLITCNPDNEASKKTCERLGGELVDIVDLPKDMDMYTRGERKKCIYKINLK